MTEESPIGTDESFDVEIPQEIWDEARAAADALIQAEDEGLVELGMLLFARYEGCPAVSDPEDYWLWMAAPIRQRFIDLNGEFEEAKKNIRVAEEKRRKNLEDTHAKREAFLAERIRKLEDSIERALTVLNSVSGTPEQAGSAFYPSKVDEVLAHLNQAL